MTLDETERLLREGKDAALKRMGNAIGRRNDDEDYAYFRMREQQFELLRGIVHHAEELVLVVEEGKKSPTSFGRLVTMSDLKPTQWCTFQN